jgi:hypothetical protein
VILELLALSAGVSAVAVFLARRKRRDAADPSAADAKRLPTDAKPPANRAASKPASAAKPTSKNASKSAQKNPAPKPADNDAPRGLRIDDVVLYADTELWLAGALHLEEDGFAMRVFRTPGSTRATWLVQLDENANDLALCDVTTEVPAGTVPESLPIGGLRLTLRRRGHARLRTEGAEVPRHPSRARYIELTGPGGRTLVIIDFDTGERLALVGDRIGRELLDLLPGGDLKSDA